MQNEVFFMASCVVFCAGAFSSLIRPLEKNDYVLAADGGFVHTQQLGLQPDGILGDFDSLGYIPQGANVFPVKKDDTDAMLAARHGLSKGYTRFLFYGSLDGPRLDHTVANFQTLLFLANKGATGFLIGENHIVTLIRNGVLTFPGEATGTVSVFCLGEDAEGVSIEGLAYPLESGTLSAGFPLGVSHHFTGAPARIRVEKGSLLIIYDRKNGLDGIVHGKNP